MIVQRSFQEALRDGVVATQRQKLNVKRDVMLLYVRIN